MDVPVGGTHDATYSTHDVPPPTASDRDDSVAMYDSGATAGAECVGHAVHTLPVQANATASLSDTGAVDGDTPSSSSDDGNSSSSEESSDESSNEDMGGRGEASSEIASRTRRQVRTSVARALCTHIA